jgi:hypothetical protein
MDTSLKDFVRQVLLDITEAVEEAKHKSPVSIAPGSIEGKLKSEPQLVQFDISVSSSTASKRSTKKQGSATVVTILKAEVSGDTTENSKSQETNRIKFSVPVYFQAYLPRHNISKN